jgi:hypothetical protein
MPSMWEAPVHSKHNLSNVSHNFHMIPIKGKHVGIRWVIVKLRKAQRDRVYRAILHELQRKLSSMKNTFTTMEPPKLEVPRQSCRKPRSNLRTPQQPQGREQQPPQPTKFINLDEIPLPNMKPRSPTPAVEETQQTTPLGMDIDMPEVG